MTDDNSPGGPLAEHPVPCSAEVGLEPWLRAVRHLQAAGLPPIVPAAVSFRLLDLHGLIVHGPVELPWTEAA